MGLRALPPPPCVHLEYQTSHWYKFTLYFYILRLLQKYWFLLSDVEFVKCFTAGRFTILPKKKSKYRASFGKQLKMEDVLHTYFEQFLSLCIWKYKLTLVIFWKPIKTKAEFGKLHRQGTAVWCKGLSYLTGPYFYLSWPPTAENQQYPPI